MSLKRKEELTLGRSDIAIGIKKMALELWKGFLRIRGFDRKIMSGDELSGLALTPLADCYLSISINTTSQYLTNVKIY